MNASDYVPNEVTHDKLEIQETLDQEIQQQSTSTSEVAIENNDNGSTSEFVNEGLDIWNKRRELWTRGNQNLSETSDNRNNPALMNITPNNYNSIYDSLVHEKKKLVKPIPLSYVIKVMVSGWKRDGICPTDPPPASSSNTNGQSSQKS
ncbi:4453_t:CDS:2 [Scutellospora calospora]|uniref:4453_t:CDS:1 n=1 Tax=Scutellospora calospora TaxID=85575 RepID=A0ACA9KX00_9GLOM|nr:4453_t:CDS:2 [Scutellospora calospora]